MFLSATCRLSVPLAASIFRASIAVAETTTVGAVDKVQAQVEATQAGQTRGLVVKSEIYFKDRCHSTEGARLQATLKDGTQLTLGENATLVVDEFIYDPSSSRGELSIRVVKGAFLYVGGRIEGVNGAKVQIRTPVGAIGLRGTTVWGGPIDNGYGVIVLNGEVTVTGRRGAVTLKQGQGTMLFGDGKPRRAAAWPAGRMKRAVASITFGKLPARGVGFALAFAVCSPPCGTSSPRCERTRQASGRIPVMTDKIEGSPSQHKPSRVRRDADGSDILASFDTLEDAVRNVRRRHGGWRYVIHDGRKIVWGAKVDRPLPREHGGCDEFLSRHRNGARMATAAVRVNDFFQGTDMLPVQCKMARAALGLGVSELAAKAGVSPDTVFRLEKGEALHQRTGIAIREALEHAGVVFIDENGEGAGVRLRKAMLK